jgi:hypothetical protein
MASVPIIRASPRLLDPFPDAPPGTGDRVPSCTWARSAIIASFLAGPVAGDPEARSWRVPYERRRPEPSRAHSMQSALSGATRSRPAAISSPQRSQTP